VDEELQQLKSLTRLPGRNVSANTIKSQLQYSPHTKKLAEKDIYIHVYIYLFVMYDYIYYQEHSIVGSGWVRAWVGWLVGSGFESGVCEVILSSFEFRFLFGRDAGRCSDSMGCTMYL